MKNEGKNGKRGEKIQESTVTRGGKIQDFYVKRDRKIHESIVR